ncbi:hypothetical protein PV735_31745 [Streptomyces turgidiscabies]|uniref:hypothetical protein n=1 Tax=Streptomyces turgidiscabies TaxID=85558 RepID=UPI0029B361BC|nr:hypothetical protein [Streptomyces turgidiscabies]MDX3497226.1 hypothetical protein [Streptomyces turgidiscabies]
MSILTPEASTVTPDPTIRAQVEADLAATFTEYGIEPIELDGPFDGLYGHYLEQDGTRLLVVPTGQDPATTLWAARTLIANQQVMPV